MEESILLKVSVSELKNLISEAVADKVKHLSPPQKDPEFITRAEVVKILGISLPTLNDWTKRGLIPALRIGTRIRYEKQMVYRAFKQIETLKYKRG